MQIYAEDIDTRSPRYDIDGRYYNANIEKSESIAKRAPAACLARL